jgi:hypothetical protein
LSFNSAGCNGTQPYIGASTPSVLTKNFCVTIEIERCSLCAMLTAQNVFDDGGFVSFGFVGFE